MSKNISNDAIWEKLSEIDEKLEGIISKQKTLYSIPEQVENEPALKNIKDEIITNIKADIRLLGLSNDSHFDANLKNIKVLHNDILSIGKAVKNLSISKNSNIDEIKALIEKKDLIRFGFIKFSKTSFIISVFGILVFILTIFCMKLYSDSIVNQNNHYKQLRVTKELQTENDSLKRKVTSVTEKKMKK